MGRRKRLTAKQARFVDAYLGPANGNATAAALLAGYSQKRTVAAQQGFENLRKPEIVAELQARQTRNAARAAKAIADAAERDAITTSIARDISNRPTERMVAVRHLDRLEGRGMGKRENVNTLEDWLQRSRDKEREPLKAVK